MAQLAGGVAGAALANLMYELPALELAATERSGAGLVLAEVVATAGLVTVVFALARNRLAAWSAPAVGAYIGAAYGSLVGATLVLALYPDVGAAADDVVVPHEGSSPTQEGGDRR